MGLTKAIVTSNTTDCQLFARRLGSKGFAPSKGSGGARCRVGIRVNLNTRSEDPVEPSPALDQAARTLIDGFDL